MTSSGTYTFSPSNGELVLAAYERIGALIEQKCVVYVARNIINGKCYVGATEKGIKQRKHKHFWNAKNGHKSKFYSAIRKHGQDAFDFSILMICRDFLHALEEERRFIAELHPEYNLTDGGGGVKGFKFSEESKAKMRAAKIGKPSIWSKVSMPQELRDTIAATRRSENRILTEKNKAKLRINAAKANCARRRPVICANDGIKYPSLSAASKAYGITTGNISNYCKGKFTSRRGLIFRYAD